jgi:hypothetical protein
MHACMQTPASHLALGVVEVSGHGDNGLLDLVIQELGSVISQLAQHKSTDLLRCKLLVASVGRLDLNVGRRVLNQLGSEGKQKGEGL